MEKIQETYNSTSARTKEASDKSEGLGGMSQKGRKHDPKGSAEARHITVAHCFRKGSVGVESTGEKREVTGQEPKGRQRQGVSEPTGQKIKNESPNRKSAKKSEADDKKKSPKLEKSNGNRLYEPADAAARDSTVLMFQRHKTPESFFLSIESRMKIQYLGPYRLQNLSGSPKTIIPEKALA